MNRFSLILVLLVALVLNSCSKSDPNEATDGDVEIYLVKSFNESDDNDFIDISTVVLEKDPLLDYSDLLSYNSKDYTFKIEDSKKDLFKIDGSTIHFKAFAVLANDEVIYTGFFWPSYSSQGINWVVIDPLTAEMQGELIVSLGYPGMLANEDIPDLRNDSRIISIFKRDNKLVE